MIKIYLMNGSEEVQSFDFDNDEILVGRSPDNNIRIKDSFVSRNHIRISRKGKRFFVRDLRSRNGTFVNGKQISPDIDIEVKEGVAISVGMSILCIGKACLDDVMPFVDSIYLSEDFDEGLEGFERSRPLTARKNMELIYKVSKALRQSADLNEVLEKILDYLFDLLKRIDRGAIILVDEDSGKISKVFSVPRRASEDGPRMFSHTIVDRVVRTAKAIVMSDTLSEDRSERSDSMEVMKVRSVMCVPLMSRSKIRGVIYVDSLNRPNGFRQDDLALLTALCTPAAVAIENASLYSTLEKVRGGDKSRLKSR